MCSLCGLRLQVAAGGLVPWCWRCDRLPDAASIGLWALMDMIEAEQAAPAAGEEE